MPLTGGTKTCLPPTKSKHINNNPPSVPTSPPLILRLFTTSILLLSTLCACFAAKNDKERSDSLYLNLVERADSAIEADNYSEAIDFLQQAMRLRPGNPQNVMLLSNTGMLHYYLGNDSLALNTLNIAHQMAPVSVTVLMNRARVNNGLGRFSDAINDYALINELDSTITEAWVQRGILQLRGGDVRGAENSLAEAAKLDADDESVLTSMALLYSRTNRPKESLTYLNKLIKKHPSAELYAERALCRIRLDDLGGASEDIADGLHLDDTLSELYVARALLNRKRYREKDARADAMEAQRKGASADYLRSLGFSL